MHRPKGRSPGPVPYGDCLLGGLTGVLTASVVFGVGMSVWAVGGAQPNLPEITGSGLPHFAVFCLMLLMPGALGAAVGAAVGTRQDDQDHPEVHHPR